MNPRVHGQRAGGAKGIKAPSHLLATVPDPHPHPRAAPPRSPPAPTVAPLPPAAPAAPGRRFPEPPAFRAAGRPEGPRACASCAGPVTFRTAPPLCWGCGRALCVDCYWRHGLARAAHLCTSCAGRGETTSPSTARSGGHRASASPP